MAGIGQWWGNLDPKERTLIAVGVPGVAVAAVYSAMKSKKTPAKAAADATAAPAITVTGAPEFSVPDSGSAAFDLYRQLTAYLEDVKSNGGGSAPTPTATPGDPCSPGPNFSSGGCSESALVASCIATNGNAQVLSEMYARRHSINDPTIKGTECGRQYALWLLARGAIPT
jgi:hypothetical protein